MIFVLWLYVAPHRHRKKVQSAPCGEKHTPRGYRPASDVRASMSPKGNGVGQRKTLAVRPGSVDQLRHQVRTRCIPLSKADTNHKNPPFSLRPLAFSILLTLLHLPTLPGFRIHLRSQQLRRPRPHHKSDTVLPSQCPALPLLPKKLRRVFGEQAPPPCVSTGYAYVPYVMNKRKGVQDIF